MSLWDQMALGKTTTANAILNNPMYTKNRGNILLEEEDITHLKTDEIARKGIFMSFQSPEEIPGVSVTNFLKYAKNKITGKPVKIFEFKKELENSMKELNMNPKNMERSLNVGFSGGEKKKNEILQMKMLKPKFIILDELDSGLDVDSLKIVCKNVTEYLQENKDASVLMITHYHKIFNYIKPDYVHVLMEKEIKLTGDLTLAEEIEKKGYKNLISCASKISGV